MKRVIISAPFGNYLRFPNATSTLGTYTLHPRFGLWGRLWRVLSTVRYDPQQQSWVNRLGLPNPGINSLVGQHPNHIVSIHGFGRDEWKMLLDASRSRDALATELNLSCPNVGAIRAEEVADAVSGHRGRLIAKLPPVGVMEMGERLYEAGVRWFHLCNTLPTAKGGLSGKPLMRHSLRAVADFRKRFGDSVTLIGGGGITTPQDASTYLRAGADHISVASVLFNPLLWSKVSCL